MRKLLIAESAEDFRFALEDALCTAYRVKTCANGMISRITSSALKA